MFLGQYRHSLDSKDRLTVPARYRQVLGDCLYVTKGFEKCLVALTDASFTAMYLSLQDKSLTDPKARDLRRIIFSNAYLLDIDKAGRVLIPRDLREAVNITNEVILVGAGNYAEIWAPDEWSKHSQLLEDETITERFTAFDLATRNVASTSTLQ